LLEKSYRIFTSLPGKFAIMKALICINLEPSRWPKLAVSYRGRALLVIDGPARVFDRSVRKSA
jgi:hypothetical protein